MSSELPSAERVGESWGPEARRAFDILQRSELICSVARSEDSVTVVYDEVEDPPEDEEVESGERKRYLNELARLTTCVNTLYVELTGGVTVDMSRVSSTNNKLFIFSTLSFCAQPDEDGDGIVFIDHPISRQERRVEEAQTDSTATEATQSNTTASITKTVDPSSWLERFGQQ
ncbi:MAG: hypothetical protein QF755_04260 [Candidatus Peribacteraceae bacterium]|jgi:hypothetical protein|nr:hypothetical protein [Parcubacteria group bacterium]MDP6575674.1 hypothetical protein [Candidatus Peribacteraceae bacterium]HCI03349.1 hypothetical protein [Candidatus Peribacteria bacterium]|tara:strand:+ start:6073 stop:6591 length:519 start_codon:yes stop_codon:yes gene_type:complete